MNPIPFIDIHTHNSKTEEGTINIKNLFPGQSISDFDADFYSVGIHPWYIKSKPENEKQLDLVKECLTNSQVIFVGECGLDLKTKTDFSEQIRVFESQAHLAEVFGKPLIIHCVKAHNEIMRLHNKIKPKMPWIFHGYNANVQTTKQMLKKNFLFSFGKMLFKNNSKALESFQFLPIDKIFFETDEYDGGIEKIYRQGSVIKEIEIEEFKKEVWKNFKSLKDV